MMSKAKKFGVAGLTILTLLIITSSNVFALSESSDEMILSQGSITVGKSTPIDFPFTSPQTSSSSSLGSGRGGSAFLSPNEFRVLLNGGRRYDSMTKKWSTFIPKGLYRENLQVSYVEHRNKVGASPSPIVFYNTVE